MKRRTLVMAAALLGAAAQAQYWKALGRGTLGPTEVQTLFGDSISDRLLAGGTFMWIMNDQDTVLGMGQAAWNGTRWDSLAHRIQEYGGGNGAQQTFWFLRFNDHLYACGGFTLPITNGPFNRYLARLNEQSGYWEPLECTNTSEDGMMTWVPQKPGTTLYATGYLGSICGYPESCVFRYDGSAFHPWPPFDQIPDYPNNHVGTVFDFQGYTYMTGLFRDPVGSGWASFLRWNGTTWEHVPGWNILDPIKEILVHNGTLFVAGTFRTATGGPGNLVASFDGAAWNDLGGGLAYTPVPMSGAALDLEWYHGNLMACGRFNLAGDAPCTSIAQWDGQRWCALAGDLRGNQGSIPGLSDMAIWRDSLYVCGGITTVDGDTMLQVIQWIGGDALGECSTTGIQQPGSSEELSISPLPTPGQWAVHLPKRGNWQLVAYNAGGQQVGQWRTPGTELTIDLAAHPPGLYLLRTLSGEGELLSTKLFVP